MCDFVLVAFPESAVPAARGVLRSTFGMQPANNASFDAQIPDDWTAVVLMEGMCGCDMYCDPDRVERVVPLEERARAFREKHAKPRYRKRGWTEERVEQAIAEMEERTARMPDFNGLRIDVRRTLVELARATGAARVLVHTFTGGIETERLTVAAERQLALDAFLAGTPPVQRDVLYEVVSRPTVE